MRSFILVLILSTVAANAAVLEHEAKYLSLMDIFRIPKKIPIDPSTLNELKLDEGVIRIWVCAITENKSYMLRLVDREGDVPKLFEFTRDGLKPLKSKPTSIPAWLPGFFENQLILGGQEGSMAASVQHSFIIETIKNGKYMWAFRKIQDGKASDYGKLTEWLPLVFVDGVDIGWTIDWPLK